MNKPKNANELMVIVNKNIDVFIDRSSPIQEKPATRKMIEKNMRYISKHDGLEKLWSNPVGQESILYAFSESLEHAATMPEMGSIVPFGKDAQFIPAIECYEFLLSNGKNPIMKNIFIIPVFSNDIKKSWSNNEGFHYEIEHGMPRGEIIGIYVGGTMIDSGIIVGTSYDESFLMSIAEEHSRGYQYYLEQKEDFARMKTEGKLDKDKNGKECIKKNGKFGEYYTYEKNILNPYVGPNKIKMLMKTAGKHFFKKYIRTRNAVEMAGEWKEEDNSTIEKAADNVLDKAAKQFDDLKPGEKPDETKIKDAEIIVDKKENDNIFDDEGVV